MNEVLLQTGTSSYWNVKCLLLEVKKQLCSENQCMSFAGLWMHWALAIIFLEFLPFEEKVYTSGIVVNLSLHFGDRNERHISYSQLLCVYQCAEVMVSCIPYFSAIFHISFSSHASSIFAAAPTPLPQLVSEQIKLPNNNKRAQYKFIVKNWSSD